jgi:hypothetical protein
MHNIIGRVDFVKRTLHVDPRRAGAVDDAVCARLVPALAQRFEGNSRFLWRADQPRNTHGKIRTIPAYGATSMSILAGVGVVQIKRYSLSVFDVLHDFL